MNLWRWAVTADSDPEGHARSRTLLGLAWGKGALGRGVGVRAEPGSPVLARALGEETRRLGGRFVLVGAWAVRGLPAVAGLSAGTVAGGLSLTCSCGGYTRSGFCKPRVRTGGRLPPTAPSRGSRPTPPRTRARPTATFASTDQRCRTRGSGPVTSHFACRRIPWRRRRRSSSVGESTGRLRA